MTAELVERVLDRYTARIRLELDGAHFPLAAGKLDFHLRVGAPLLMAAALHPAHGRARLRKVGLQDLTSAALDTRCVHRSQDVYVSVNRVIIENRCGESIPLAERLGELSFEGRPRRTSSVHRAGGQQGQWRVSYRALGRRIPEARGRLVYA